MLIRSNEEVTECGNVSSELMTGSALQLNASIVMHGGRGQTGLLFPS